MSVSALTVAHHRSSPGPESPAGSKGRTYRELFYLEVQLFYLDQERLKGLCVAQTLALPFGWGDLVSRTLGMDDPRLPAWSGSDVDLISIYN